MPARRAGQNSPATCRVPSVTRMPRRISAEIVSSTASASSANGAPTSLIRAPASPGPATSADELASAFFAWASTSRSRGTICVRTICAALPAIVYTVPIAKPTTVEPGHRQPSRPPRQRHAGDEERQQQFAPDVDRQLAHAVEVDARMAARTARTAALPSPSARPSALEWRAAAPPPSAAARASSPAHRTN